jgi:hypothetical protein
MGAAAVAGSSGGDLAAAAANNLETLLKTRSLCKATSDAGSVSSGDDDNSSLTTDSKLLTFALK